MSDRNYLEEAMPCPKCGNPNCALEVHVNQERENTCPECGTTFTDAHEQFGPMTYVGLYHEGGEETDPPFAMFRDRDAVDRYLKIAAACDDEDTAFVARNLIPTDTTVYGAYWNSSEENPYGDKPIPFTPEDIPRQPSEGGSTEVTASVKGDWPVRMTLMWHLGLAPVYFCGNNQRWYVFVRMPRDKLEIISINDAPRQFLVAYFNGVKNGMLKTAQHVEKQFPLETLHFMTWEQFTAAGGTVSVPPLDPKP